MAFLNSRQLHRKGGTFTFPFRVDLDGPFVILGYSFGEVYTQSATRYAYPLGSFGSLELAEQFGDLFRRCFETYT